MTRLGTARHTRSAHSQSHALPAQPGPYSGPLAAVLLSRYAKKQVLDESGTLSNLLQLWQLVVRHPDVFYDSRAQFMSQMINTLSRIGMPQQASLENRKLSLDLAGLLLAWEAKRRQAITAEAAPAAAGEAGPGVAGSAHQPGGHMCTGFMLALVQVIASQEASRLAHLVHAWYLWTGW